MKPAHFVIVDDDAINNRLCQLCIVRHFGAVPIKSFQNPELALQFLAADYGQHDFTPTVLLLDIHMPQMSGWDFLAKFASFAEEIKSQFKIYILSSSTDYAHIDMADKHPLVSGFLSKPLTEVKIEKVFRELPEVFGVRCFS
jgi:two-component SAPR family response regulator